MTAELINFPGPTRLDQPADKILSDATSAQLTSVVIMGYDADGDEYFASSLADGGDILWLMERLKHKMMTGATE